MKRRDFLRATVASVMLGGCGGAKHMQDNVLPEPNEAQKARRRQGRSTVGIIQCPSYQDDIFQAIKPHIDKLGLPDLKGKHVVLKPNIVEFHPGHPITTNPAALLAAVQLVDYLGAKEITIGEGPGHMRDTQMLLENSGIGKMLAQHKLRFVDLNLDDLERLEVSDSFAGLKEIFLPKTIVHADAVVSVPKMKTHHWVGMTASMKNLFGTVPGRKYGWPKNMLHVRGIPECIIDLQHLVKPTFGFVDGIIAMEGDGPINGTDKEMGFVVIGSDLAAVDSTCARTMSVPVEKLPYIRMAGKVVGNIDPESIDIVGPTIESVRKQFDMPVTFKDKRLMDKSKVQAG